MPTDHPPREERTDVARPDRQQDGERRELALAGDLPQEHEMCKTEADPGRAEHRRSDRHRRRLPRGGDPVQQEREHQRAEETRHRPFEAGQVCTEQRENRACVRRQDDRTQRADHQRVLVQRENRRNARKRKQPPASGPDDHEHERQADERDHHARN